MVIFNNEQSQATANSILNSLTTIPSPTRKICLMSGPMPTYAQFDSLTGQEKVDVALGIDTTYIALGTIDILDTDITMSPLGTGNIITIALEQKDRQLGLPNVGTVSWFLLLNTDVSGSAYIDTGLSVIGTTGLVGSGADLELSSINMGPTVEFTTKDITIILHRDY